MFLYAATILLSAFLLFQVQPMIAKMILPWFGGTAAVWATCLVFFQLVLLLGYLYAHASAGRIRPRSQRILHTVLLLCSLAALPVLPDASWKPASPDDPIGRILLLLALTAGLPYFLLSTTGPLVQAWFVQARPGESPYRLFALSNLGSMLALLSYPVAIEPQFTLKQQAYLWSGGFALFALLCAATAWNSLRGPVAARVPDAPGETAPDSAPVPGAAEYLTWLCLAAVPSMLLLALTSHMSMDLAPIPFLWVAPLSLYLLSFILCFDARGWYRRRAFLAVSPFALGAMLWLYQSEHESRPGVHWCVLIFLACFFVCAMVCHGELSIRRPPPVRLTGYYLMISAGGAMGGVLVALLAPVTLPAFYEFPVAVALCGVAVAWAAFQVEQWPFREGLLTWPSIVLLSLTGILLGTTARIMREEVSGSMLVTRNFYGELRVRQYNGVYDWDGYRTLVHGSINHGEQYTHPSRRREAVSYYCSDSGLGRYMASRVIGLPQRVAVVGLGTGSIAAYSRFGDLYRFYEINPAVERIAHEQFTYLKEAEAPVEVALGDGRLSLEREPPQGFDLIVLDAFSSDSIPVHLLTRDAMALYFRHLRPDGVLAVHISNRYIELEPVLERAAAHFRKHARVVETDDNKEGTCYGTTWVLLTGRGELFDRQEFQTAEVKPLSPAGWLRPWTDDFSNLYRLLK